jgi:hypothetical protein
VWTIAIIEGGCMCVAANTRHTARVIIATHHSHETTSTHTTVLKSSHRQRGRMQCDHRKGSQADIYSVPILSVPSSSSVLTNEKRSVPMHAK